MQKIKDKKELIKYIKSLGVSVNTNTKARGNKGFYSRNRIDISKNITDERFLDTLAHEFAHYIHSKIEPESFAKGGTLEKLFNCENTIEIKKELTKVTHFIDPNSTMKKLLEIKEQYKNKIKQKENEIKIICPDFQRSKTYKPFEKAIKKSKARYLLKYDRVKFITPFLRKVEYYSISTAHLDFPELKPEYINILKLKSLQKKQTNNSRRINKYIKYYSLSSELFARFIQSLIYDYETTKNIAPKSCERFFELLKQNYYRELKYLFS